MAIEFWFVFLVAKILSPCCTHCVNTNSSPRVEGSLLNWGRSRLVLNAVHTVEKQDYVAHVVELNVLLFRRFQTPGGSIERLLRPIPTYTLPTVVGSALPLRGTGYLGPSRSCQSREHLCLLFSYEERSDLFSSQVKGHTLMCNKRYDATGCLPATAT